MEIDETNLKKELNNKNYSISDNDLIQKLTDSKQEIDKIVAIEEE